MFCSLEFSASFNAYIHYLCVSIWSPCRYTPILKCTLLIFYHFGLGLGYVYILFVFKQQLALPAGLY